MASPLFSRSLKLDDFVTLEYILVGDLRDLLEEPMNEVTRKWLIAVLDALLETLPRRMELQAEGGFMTEVLDEFPSWFSHVEQLKNEYQDVYCKLADLRETVNSDDSHEDLKRLQKVLSHDLREWMTHLAAYHRHERRLVQTAFTLDVGAGD